jgi:hypothetical protein
MLLQDLKDVRMAIDAVVAKFLQSDGDVDEPSHHQSFPLDAHG